MLCTREGGGLPDDSYGFNFTNDPSEDDPDEDEPSSLQKERLPDRVLLLKGTSYTCRFILGEYEYKSCRHIGGQMYAGDGSDETQVVAKLSGWKLIPKHPATKNAGFVMAQGFHCVADAIDQETYEMSVSLFDPKGVPVRKFGEQMVHKGQQHTVVYLSGVFVKSEHRKQELGLEFTRALLLTLQDEGLWGGPCAVALLCPAGDPPFSRSSNHKSDWGHAFGKLSTHFRKLGFTPCGGSTNRPSDPIDQNMYLFLEADPRERWCGLASKSSGAGKQSATVVPPVGPSVGSKRKAGEGKGKRAPTPGGTTGLVLHKCKGKACKAQLKKLVRTGYTTYPKGTVHPEAQSVHQGQWHGVYTKAETGYLCSVCDDGPYCDDCWPEDIGSFCGGKCSRFFCDVCLASIPRGMLFSESGEMYCQVECASPGTKFLDDTSDEDGEDDDEDEDDW